MIKSNQPERITKPKILLVEGQDEVHLFTELLHELQLERDIQIIEAGGKDQFPHKLKGLKKHSDFNLVQSIGIIRDADNDPTAAFQSVRSGLQHAKLPVPASPLVAETGPPRIVITIVPDPHTKGMLEDVCLSSVSDDPSLECVDQYFQCLRVRGRESDVNVVPKARVRAFLASRAWLEIAIFEYLQKCLENYQPTTPQSPAIAVPKVQAFLASRYTPHLDLGIAARKSDREDRYWQFAHPAFDKIKQFLLML